MVVDDAIVARRADALDRRRTGHDRRGVRCAPGARRSNRSSACDPDVVVLDVDMPELDGISALPLLLAKKKRDLVVIMASTLTRRSAEISLRALSLGAADYVPKPEAAPDATMSGVPPRADRENPQSRPRGRRPGARRRGAAGASGRCRRRRAGAGAGLPAAETAAAPRPFARAAPRALLIGSRPAGRRR
jgi:two-component system chemotaxis response regulator CheB